MRIAFYAPLKPPGHPSPSGDRKMARQLANGLRESGHDVEIISELRARLADSGQEALARLQAETAAEVERLASAWTKGEKPDIVLCYHPYYRSPDLIGWPLAEHFALPYVTIEASWSQRKAEGEWAKAQKLSEAAILGADLNFVFTPKDRAGLLRRVDTGKIADLPPFIQTGEPIPVRSDHNGPARLITVAMMREGSKVDSYRLLASAIGELDDLDWTLDIIGGGPAEPAVRALFAPFGERVRFAGEIAPEKVESHLRQADIYAYPGINEAYGLAYLEAQWQGLPVVAVANAGVPVVVANGRSGLLTGADPKEYASALRMLISDDAKRHAMGMAAQQFVLTERSGEAAMNILVPTLKELAGAKR